MSTIHEGLKRVARIVATVSVLPLVASYYLRASVLGRSRALEGSSQFLAILPGMPGRYIRVAFLRWVLRECHASAVVEYGTLFSQVGARIGENAYVGPDCHIGLAHIERDVLLAAGVHVPSGGRRHGIRDVSTPIREQPGQVATVTIGQGTWVGSAAVILADVGRHCVIGAGAVVSKPLPDFVVAAGVPAKILRNRLEGEPIQGERATEHSVP